MKLLNKRTLYIICFIALCYIDFLRNTQTGDVWKAASNCTGLVLAVIIFSAYPLKQFCNVFSYIWTAICLCIAGYVVFFGDYFVYKEIYKWTFVFAVLNVLWLGVFAGYFFKITLIKKELTLKPSIIGWQWIVMSFFMTFNLSGRLWPAWFFLMFGAFYITEYTEEDFSALAEAMITGTLIAFFILQMYCYAFRPYDEMRYKGAYPNSNVAAVHYLWVYTCILIKLHFLHKKNAHKGWKIFYFIGAAGMLDFMIMTMCRSAWLSSIVVTIVYGIFVMIKNWKQTWKNAFTKGIILCAMTVVLFPITFATVRWLPTIHPHPIWHEGEYQEWRIHSWDPANAWQYTELNEFLEQLLGRLRETLQIASGNPLVMQVEAADILEDSFEVIEVKEGGLGGATGGRLAIYKAYIEDMTLLGHPETGGNYKIGEGENAYVSWHAQNLWIQIGYSYGIPAGILLIALTILLLFYREKQFRQNPDNMYAVIPLMISVMFFTFGLTELNWNVGQYPLFLIFFVQHKQFVKLKDGEK